ncbi:MAG: 2'-5' RNA ligase family protein [Rhizomicrobium sp.]
MAARTRRKFGPSQKERIFFACLPGKETAARIYAQAETFKQEHGFTGTLILPEHLHVTLFHLGDWAALPEEIVKLAKDAAGQVKATPFNVAFPRAESFRNSTGVFPFVLTGNAKEWQALHTSLAATLTKAGLGGATRGEFKPHVTLVYDKVRVKPLKITPFSWTVQEFVLVHSVLGKTTHNHLGRWPLS